jgi:hypothetical protein
MLIDLKLQYLCEKANHLVIETTMTAESPSSISLPGSIMPRKLTVHGSTDLMIFDQQESCNPEKCISHIELKAPMKGLFQSASSQEKDQLFGQTFCLTAMKLEDDEQTDKVDGGWTIGGLTDMFSLNIMMQDWKTKIFYVTGHVIDPVDYIHHLLLLFIQFDKECIGLFNRYMGEMVQVEADEDEATEIKGIQTTVMPRNFAEKKKAQEELW